MSDLISRDAAFDEIIWNSDNGVIDAKVAIEELRKLPSVEPEKCGDCISRQATLEILDDYAEDIESGNWGTAYSKARKSMCDLPSVEPERKSGIWKHEDAGVWICGVCGEEVGEMGYEYGVPKYNFCPYCGADMTGRRWKNDK